MQDKWQRLSRWSIVFFFFQSLKQLTNLYPVLIGGGVAVGNSGLSFLQISLIVMAIITLIFTASIVHYLNFRYVQQENKFLIKSGLFNKKRLELPFERIQNINVEHPFYFRPINLVNLSLDSAGSAKSEIHLAALEITSANEIKHSIEGFHQTNIDEGYQSIDQALKSDDVLMTRSLKDIIIHGLTNNRVWLIVAAASPFIGSIQEFIVNTLANFGINIGQWIDNQPTVILIISVLILFVIFSLFMSLLSILGSVFSYFDYQLKFKNDSYTRQSGLLTRHEIHIKRSRIQSVYWQQSWLDRLIGRLNMVMEPFNAVTHNAQQNLLQKLVVPSIKPKQFNKLSQHCLTNFTFKPELIKPISRYYLMRYNLWLTLPSLIITIGFNVMQDFLIWWLIPVIPITLATIIFLRWRRYGYYFDNRYLVMCKGFFGVNYFCIDQNKIQQATFSQSVFLRSKFIGNVKLVLASRAINIPLINQKDAYKIVNNGLYVVEQNQQSWM